MSARSAGTKDLLYFTWETNIKHRLGCYVLDTMGGRSFSMH